MQILNPHNIGEELKRWFSKSILIYDEIDFSDIPLFENALNKFLYDYQRYFESDKSLKLEKLLSRTELIGILLYRIAREYYINKNEFVAQQYSLLGRFLSGFEIYYSSQIGKGLKINHGLGTVIGARVVIGDNALLHQGITFGDKNGGRPILLNNVTVYAGAKLLGNISIGNNCIIAANTVCFIDVEDNSTVVGIPAKIISKK